MRPSTSSPPGWSVFDTKKSVELPGIYQTEREAEIAAIGLNAEDDREQLEQELRNLGAWFVAALIVCANEKHENVDKPSSALRAFQSCKARLEELSYRPNEAIKASKPKTDLPWTSLLGDAWIIPSAVAKQKDLYVPGPDILNTLSNNFPKFFHNLN